MTLPLWLTLGRMFLIPPLVVAFYALPPAVALGLFLLAAVTDWLDGYLARRWHQTSALGAWLDPLADKLLVATALLLLVSTSHSVWLTVMAVILVNRELAVTALRGYLGEQAPPLAAAVAVSFWGKGKTAAQLVALSLLLTREPTAFALGLGLLTVATALSLGSFLEYAHRARCALAQARR